MNYLAIYFCVRFSPALTMSNLHADLRLVDKTQRIWHNKGVGFLFVIKDLSVPIRSYLSSKILPMLLFFSSVVHAEEIHLLTASDINAAHIDLERDASKNKMVKIATIGGGAVIAGAALFWLAPSISHYFEVEKGRRAIEGAIDYLRENKTMDGYDRLSKDEQKALSHSLAAALMQKEEFIDKVARNNANKSWFSLKAWGSWLYDQGKSFSSFIPMVGASLVSEPIAEKLKEIFGKRNVIRLVNHRLSIPQHFKGLKFAQVCWYPKKFLANAHNAKDQEMCNYAREVAVTFTQMSQSDIDQAYQKSRDLFIEKCNELVKSMGYVVAYMKYMTQNVADRVMVNRIADQLHSSTYEFARKIDEQLISGDIDELFNTAALFESTFVSSINSFGLFAK